MLTLTRWRYYLKMLRYEQFLVPLAMFPLFIFVTILLRDDLRGNALAAEVGRSYLEGAMPLALALVGSAMLLNDPMLELQYTLPRSLWRTQTERLGLLLAVMTLFYLAFVGLTWLLGVPWLGWSNAAGSFLVWLVPGLAWLGLALLASALLRSAAAGGGVAALVWIFTFFVHNAMLSSPLGRLFLPQLTIFDPSNADWPLNRLTLIGLGLLETGLALNLMTQGERYLGTER